MIEWAAAMDSKRLKRKLAPFARFHPEFKFDYFVFAD